MLLDNVIELIGNTPLVKLTKCVPNKTNVYAKIEKNNLSGSIKDRAAIQMILDLLDAKKIKEGDTIIEPTSGNTGIALACISNYFNLNCIIVMPSSMSLQRRKLIEDYGAKLVLVDGGMKECKEKANELNQEIEGSIIVGQFDNTSNYMAHYYSTAPEIFEDLPDADVIICGIGTGGTITGIGRYLKDNNKDTELIGVEPLSSPLITKGKAGPHKIQGIGANFIPSILDQKVVDKMLLVSDEDAINTAKMILKKEGLLVGISSGATLSAALSLLEQRAYRHKKIVVIFPDSGERYSWN